MTKSKYILIQYFEINFGPYRNNGNIYHTVWQTLNIAQSHNIMVAIFQVTSGLWVFFIVIYETPKTIKTSHYQGYY